MSDSSVLTVVASVFALMGLLTLVLGYLIGRKQKFDLVNGFREDKVLDHDGFANWMWKCYLVMGIAFLAGAAFLAATRSPAVLELTVGSIILIIAVMTFGTRRYYRL